MTVVLTESTESTASGSSVKSKSSFRSGSIDYKRKYFICERERSKKGDIQTYLVSEKGRQESIHNKAKALNDEYMLHKIEGFGDICKDMVASDFRYHNSCLNRYLNQRVPKTSAKCLVTKSTYDQAFEKLISEIDKCICEEGHIYYIITLRNRFIKYLIELGEENAETYRNANHVERLNSY